MGEFVVIWLYEALGTNGVPTKPWIGNIVAFWYPVCEDDFKGAAMKVNFTTSLPLNFRRACKLLACVEDWRL
jgi:hypothetical protein